MAAVSYRVTIERDAAGFWVAEVADMGACCAQGRSLAAAKRRIREVLGFVLESESTAARAQLVYDYSSLPKSVRASIERFERAEARIREAGVERAKAVKALGRARLSRRDVAELTGLSHQRIDQILKS